MEITNEIKNMARRAYYDVEKACKYALEKSNTQKYCSAPLYLNKAISQMCALESLYFSKFDVLENDSVSKVIDQFKTFADEFLNNYATDHSHQWTFIELENYQEAFNNSPFAFKS